MDHLMILLDTQNKTSDNLIRTNKDNLIILQDIIVWTLYVFTVYDIPDSGHLT